MAPQLAGLGNRMRGVEEVGAEQRKGLTAQAAQIEQRAKRKQVEALQTAVKNLMGMVQVRRHSLDRYLRSCLRCGRNARCREPCNHTVMWH